ncbi:MurR/RpiR family transcriptional regulator [Terasakiella sp. A23]|uniref:MurR/RpiR family transcriptional regulator n=1 Tax=Terasakiella sp. FCG-A23 TaxID=3080561 RepID=UPI002953D439|nr:MurR/RpiR family transcriptional regulator [Terasakiella sp. A23]MDV7338955.1 MurR/RpiR family transcriptional regulator [Terasakiella sp. A23]
MDFDLLKARMADHFSQMSPQVQTAARYVLDNAEDVALLSMRQLAKAADVHPTTMVRLAQALGFEGFNDLKDVFQTRMRAAPDDLVGRARGLQGQKGSTAALMEEIEQNAHNNIYQSLHGCGPEKLEAAADFLLNAKRVYVMGLRISYPVAFSFYYAYSMFRSNAQLVDGRAGTVADVLRGIGEGDVLLALSVSPFSRETVRAVNYARNRGAGILTISDSEITPLDGAGNAALVARNDSLTFFPSMTANMALVESLIAIMISKGGEDLLNVVAQSKAQLDEFDAYWEVQKNAPSPLHSEKD